MGKKKKKEKPKELSPEELAEVRSLPISVLAMARKARPRFTEQGFETVRDVEKISPNKLMLRCLVGEEEIVSIANKMAELYQASLPERWKMGQVRSNVLGKRRFCHSPRDPRIPDPVWSRLAFREGQRGHKRKQRKSERGLQ